MRNYTNNAKNLVDAIWKSNHEETRRYLLSVRPSITFYMDVSAYTKNECDIYHATPFKVAFDLNYEDIVEKLAPHYSSQYLEEYLSESVQRQNVALFDCIIEYVKDDASLDNALQMVFLLAYLQLDNPKYSITHHNIIREQVRGFCNHTVRSILLYKNLSRDFIEDVCSHKQFSVENMSRVEEMCQRETLRNIVQHLAEPNDQKKRKI